mgnify:FL=1
MEYKTLAIKKIPVEKLADPKYVEQLREQMSQIKQANQALFNSALIDWREMVKKAAYIYGVDSPEHRYIKRADVPLPPDLTADWKKLMKQFVKWQETQRKRALGREYRRRRKLAVDELEAQGFIEGVDYPDGHALRFKKKLDALPEGSIIIAPERA